MNDIENKVSTTVDAGTVYNALCEVKDENDGTCNKSEFSIPMDIYAFAKALTEKINNPS